MAAATTSAPGSWRPAWCVTSSAWRSWSSGGGRPTASGSRAPSPTCPWRREVGPPLQAVLAAHEWRQREEALTEAARRLGAATNALGLADPVDPGPRRFHTRDIRVVDAAGFTVNLAAAITDPPVRALVDRLGQRQGIGRLPGAIDQAVDSTDVLTHPARCRAAAALLGLSIWGLSV